MDYYDPCQDPRFIKYVKTRGIDLANPAANISNLPRLVQDFQFTDQNSTL